MPVQHLAEQPALRPHADSFYRIQCGLLAHELLTSPAQRIGEHLEAILRSVAADDVACAVPGQLQEGCPVTLRGHTEAIIDVHTDRLAS